MFYLINISSENPFTISVKGLNGGSKSIYIDNKVPSKVISRVGNTIVTV